MKKLLHLILLLIFSCEEPAIDGCTTTTACNYDADATKDDGSCLENDCDGVCGGGAKVDCNGDCGGYALLDDCDVCNGDGSSCICDSCLYDLSNYGSDCCDTAWNEYGISCSELESLYSWDCSGCNCPGDCLISELICEDEYICQNVQVATQIDNYQYGCVGGACNYTQCTDSSCTTCAGCPNTCSHYGGNCSYINFPETIYEWETQCEWETECHCP